MKVLVIAAHPDDDVFGCGGSIAKHVKNGNSVTIAYLTNGDAGTLTHTKEELAKVRKEEAKQAAAVLGIEDLIFLNFFDGYVEYSKEILNKLVELIREIKPQVIYMPHGKESHRDHANTFILGKEAIYRAGAQSFQECEGDPWNVSTVLCYEVWTPLSKFQYIEDITEFIELKVEAFKKHESQLANVHYDQALRGFSQYRGLLNGKGEYAECFKVLKVGEIF